jgi:peptide/nickel transport system substrate-binding protein
MVMLYFNELITDTLPFNDKSVRQALLYGLDRRRLVDEVLMGQAIIPETPLLPGTWAYSTQGVPSYPYDPQQAQTLLASAGWTRDTVTATGQNAGPYAGPYAGHMALRNAAGDPLQFTLIAANDSQDMAMAEAIAHQWARLGISVTVDGVPALALSGALESRSYQALLSHLVIPGDPDLYPLWHETQAFAGQNYAGFRHRRISEVLEQARITVDRGRRITLYQEFQQLFMEEVPA